MVETLETELNRLRLRGGGDGTDEELDSKDQNRMEDDDDDIAAIVFQNLCFGRNEELHMEVDLQAPISEIKKEIYRKFPTSVCPADQMELIWRGNEMSDVNHETLSQHGLRSEEGGTKIRIILRQKFLAAEAVADQKMRKSSADYPSMMQQMQNPKVILELLKSNPQLQAMWNANPEIRQMLSDPENLRQILPQLMNAGLISDQTDLMSAFGQDDDMGSMMRQGFNLGDEEQRRSKAKEAEAGIIEMAKLNAAELKESLRYRPESTKKAVLEAREILFEAKEGWDRKAFRESLRMNATLARQYAQLYQERGSVDEIRKALLANRSLAREYSLLATLLNCMKNASSAPDPRAVQGGPTRSPAEAQRGLEERSLSRPGVASEAGSKGITFGSLQAALDQANQELKKPSMASGSKRSLDEVSPQAGGEGKEVAATPPASHRSEDASVRKRSERSIGIAPREGGRTTQIVDQEKESLASSAKPEQQPLGLVLDRVIKEFSIQGRSSRRADDDEEGMTVDFGDLHVRINATAKEEGSLLRMLRGARANVKVLIECGETLAARRRIRDSLMLLPGLSEGSCLQELRKLSAIISSLEPLESDRTVLNDIRSVLLSRPGDKEMEEDEEDDTGQNTEMEDGEEDRKREKMWAECRSWLELMIQNQQLSAKYRALHDEERSSCPQLVHEYARMNVTEMRRQLEEDDLPYEEMEQAYKLEEEGEEEGGAVAGAIDPREKYSSQLVQLIEMGFEDEEANLLALIDTGGSVENAINKLVS